MVSRPPRLAYWILGVAALIAAISLLGFQDVLRSSLSWIDEQGAWGPVAFIVIYVLATVLFLPGSILTLGAGLLWGIGWGFVYVSIASTVGATIAFVIGRYLARGWVAARTHENRMFLAIDSAVGTEGWRIVGLTRLSPIFPFNMLNYAFGLTAVSMRDYVMASWIGMMPGTAMYVYLGSLAGSFATLVDDGRSRTPGEWAVYTLGLCATVAGVVFITRAARSALNRQLLG